MSSPFHDEPTDLVGSERHPLTPSLPHPALFFSPLSPGEWSLGVVLRGGSHKLNYRILQPLPACWVLGWWSPMNHEGLEWHTLSLLRTLPGPCGLAPWKMGGFAEGRSLRGKIRCPILKASEKLHVPGRGSPRQHCLS